MADMDVMRQDGVAQPQLPAGRVGILGGTFNPVHIGHVRLALEVGEMLGLRRVDMMPCASPPHKPDTGLLPYELRVAMLRAAVQDLPALGVSTFEAELPQPSYTWNTAIALYECTGQIPVFILGDEDFACLETWRNGMDLPKIMDFAVVPRSGTAADLFLATLSRLWPEVEILNIANSHGILRACMTEERACWFLPLPMLEISATRIRRRWLHGTSVRYLLPDPVLTLLNAHSEDVQRIWQQTEHKQAAPSACLCE